MSAIQPIPVAEWLAEAKRRFGEDPLNWKFRCPICGNVQSLADFKAIGAEPQDAYRECVGRKQASPARDFASKPGANGTKSPCDFAAFGLFRVGTTPITSESGKVVDVFPFAEVA